MRFLLLIVTAVALGCTGCGPDVRRVGGSAPLEAVATSDGGFAVIPDLGAHPGSPQCISLALLPADCRPEGAWRLLHNQPQGECPFGASRHDITLFTGSGLLCFDPVTDLQRLQPGPAEACAVVLLGEHFVPAASQAYTETWTSVLTFTGDTGVGETTVSISGQINCSRKFQTTIDRK